MIKLLAYIISLILTPIIHYINKILSKDSSFTFIESNEMTPFIFRPFELRRVSTNGTVVPTARSGHRIVCNDTNIYCFGGFNPDHQRRGVAILFQELWKFNIHRREWTLLANSNTNMPKELASNAVILEGELLMIFGGTGFPFGESCSNKLSVCFPNRDPFIMKRVKARGEKPVPLYGQNLVYNRNHVYAVGGTTGFAYYCDIHRMSLKTKRWECVYMSRDELPGGRYRHGIACDGKLIYILGGGTALHSYDLMVVPAFDLERKIWKFITTLPDKTLQNPTYPGPRKCHSCIQYRSENGDWCVVIAGGYHNVIHYDDIWKLNLSSYQWTLMQTTKLPNPLFFHDAAASIEGCMYIFGGIMINATNNARVNDIYKIWMKIPKLSTICWEAVLHYYPNIKHITKEKLLEIGIPMTYVTALNS